MEDDVEVELELEKQLSLAHELFWQRTKWPLILLDWIPKWEQAKFELRWRSGSASEQPTNSSNSCIDNSCIDNSGINSGCIDNSNSCNHSSPLRIKQKDKKSHEWFSWRRTEPIRSGILWQVPLCDWTSVDNVHSTRNPILPLVLNILDFSPTPKYLNEKKPPTTFFRKIFCLAIQPSLYYTKVFFIPCGLPTY